MRRLGVHTSIAGGLYLSLERAHALGCTTMQIFSHNPRGWAVKSISREEAVRFQSLRQSLDISPVFIHTSYLINMASRDRVLKQKSIALLITEMERADAIGAEYVVLHTGSASGDDATIARRRAIEAFNEIAETRNWKAGLLIENTAGERGDICSSIADMGEIIDGVQKPLIAGICIDTCHAFAAGYDISDSASVEKIAHDIQHSIGIDKVKLIHMNDSKGNRASHIDRHAHIGLGAIGTKGLAAFINYPKFLQIPLILETPKKNESDDPVNLAKVRKMLRSQ
jgi:deoxyribonuclease IV